MPSGHSKLSIEMLVDGRMMAYSGQTPFYYVPVEGHNGDSFIILSIQPLRL